MGPVSEEQIDAWVDILYPILVPSANGGTDLSITCTGTWWSLLFLLCAVSVSLRYPVIYYTCFSCLILF